MVEPIMYMAIGFLVSMLLGLTVMPLVHSRAVRLTVKRLEATTPVSKAEIQADKDQLRAEFAMSARRLEMTVGQLQSKATSQLAELGKKSDAINRMKMELGEKNAAIFALEAREKALKDELATKTKALQSVEDALADKQAELTNLAAELAERSRAAAQESSEHQAQVDAAGINEQSANALLRERINGIAADVAKLAMTLEGPDSTIAAILETGRTKPAASQPAGNGTGGKGTPAAPDTLADRIRALQSGAARSAENA